MIICIKGVEDKPIPNDNIEPIITKIKLPLICYIYFFKFKNESGVGCFLVYLIFVIF